MPKTTISDLVPPCLARSALYAIPLLASISAHSETPIGDGHSLAVQLTTEWVAALDGGVNHSSHGLLNVDGIWLVDTTAAGWWQNGELQVYVLADYGSDPSNATGDSQTLSNIATDNAIKLYELWYRHTFWQEQLQLLVGLQDFNSNFYALDSAALFNHSSLGIGPEVSQVGPSIFATTALSVQVRYQTKQFYGQFATYDGIPGAPDHPQGTHVQLRAADGLFSAAEFGFDTERGKIAAGKWWHTAHVTNPITEQPMQFNSGHYVIGQWRMDDNVWLFAQLGFADRLRNQFDRYLGLGMSGYDLLMAQDQWGIARAEAQQATAYRQAQANQGNKLPRQETAWELSYGWPFSEQLSVQLSYYYIDKPLNAENADFASAFGVRCYYQFY